MGSTLFVVRPCLSFLIPAMLTYKDPFLALWLGALETVHVKLLGTARERRGVQEVVVLLILVEVKKNGPYLNKIRIFKNINCQREN